MLSFCWSAALDIGVYSSCHIHYMPHFSLIEAGTAASTTPPQIPFCVAKHSHFHFEKLIHSKTNGYFYSRSIASLLPLNYPQTWCMYNVHTSFLGRITDPSVPVFIQSDGLLIEKHSHNLNNIWVSVIDMLGGFKKIKFGFCSAPVRSRSSWLSCSLLKRFQTMGYIYICSCTCICIKYIICPITSDGLVLVLPWLFRLVLSFVTLSHWVRIYGQQKFYRRKRTFFCELLFSLLFYITLIGCQVFRLGAGQVTRKVNF